MTETQRAILHRLQRVTMPVASYDKRFRRNMSPELELTEKQAAYLMKLDHRYRRQTGGAHICTALCATYTRRQTGECFEAPLPSKPLPTTRKDAAFLKSIGISANDHAELPLFDASSASVRSAAAMSNDEPRDAATVLELLSRTHACMCAEVASAVLCIRVRANRGRMCSFGKGRTKRSSLRWIVLSENSIGVS